MPILNNKNVIWKKFYWLPIFILFLTVRLFSGNTCYPLTGDACKYLTLAKNFPFHTLYNHDLYLIHPPIFGWSIGIAHFFMPIYYAGITITVMFAILSFWGTKSLCISYGLGKLETCIALIYISLSTIYITFDSHISRVPILTFFIIMSLLNYHEYLKQKKRKLLYLTMLFTSATLLTSEQGVFLLPCLGIQYFFSKNLKKNFKSIVILAIVSILAFLIWPVVRLMVYLNNPLYPAGIDGTIEYIANDSIWPILNPNYLPYTSFHNSNLWNFSISFQHLNLMNFIGYVSQIPFIPYPLGFYVTIFIVFLMVIRIIWQKDLPILELMLMSLFLFFLCFFCMPQWYGITAIIPFGICLGRLTFFKRIIPLSKRKYGLIIIYAICTVFIFKWLYTDVQIPGNTVIRIEPGNHFIFTRGVITPGYKINQKIKLGKNDGIMAPIGLVPEMVFLTPSRCMALPMMPELLDDLIDIYNIKYLVFSDKQMRLSNRTKDNIARFAIVTNIIYNNPKKYKKIATWKEEYPDGMPSMTFYVFKTSQTPPQK